MAERLVVFLRGQIQEWQKSEGKATGRLEKLRVQFFAAVTDRWVSRAQMVLTAVESDLVRLRAEEQTAKAAHERAKGLLGWL